MCKRFFAMIFFSIVAGVCFSGCSTLKEVFGEPDTIAVDVKILDDSESIPLITTAELWLKICVEGSDVFCFVPINEIGNKTIEIKTPFLFSKNRNKMMTVELLDDDRLSKQEVELLSNAAKATGYLLCDGINFYAARNGGSDLINSDTKKLIAECTKDGVIMAANNMKAFDSLGYREFNVSGIASLQYQAIALTIVEEGMIFKTARCDLKFHLIP